MEECLTKYLSALRNEVTAERVQIQVLRKHVPALPQIVTWHCSFELTWSRHQNLWFKLKYFLDKHFNEHTFSGSSICSNLWQLCRKPRYIKCLICRKGREERPGNTEIGCPGKAFRFFVLLYAFKHINLFKATNHIWTLLSLLPLYILVEFLSFCLIAFHSD